MGKALQLECKVAVTCYVTASTWQPLAVLIHDRPAPNILKPPPAPAAAGASCRTTAFKLTGPMPCSRSLRSSLLAIYEHTISSCQPGCRSPPSL